MKKIFLPLSVLALMLSSASCSKCVTCTMGDKWTKICDKGSGSDDQDNTIKTYEALGWECKASSKLY